MIRHVRPTDSKREIYGFTLIELLVVLAIISALLTIAVPRYFQSVETSKEVVLSENLRIIRETIDKFYGDTGRYPDSLDELVEKRYLRNPPFDPFTENTTTWIVIPPQSDAKGNVYDVKSAAQGKRHDGKPYGEF